MLVERTGSRRLANAFSTGLKLIWSKSSLKSAKMARQKTRFIFLQKAPGVNGLKGKVKEPTLFIQL